jgi:hypothetical protein
MPLTEKVAFKARLQSGNRVQIPKYVRWAYKLEPKQILKTTLQAIYGWTSAQTYLTRPTKDGRIVVPNLIAQLVVPNQTNKGTFVVQVWLEPL